MMTDTTTVRPVTPAVALAVDLDGPAPRHDEPPWAGRGSHPSTTEWLLWIEAQPPAARVYFTHRLLRSAQDGARCVEAQHDQFPEELHRRSLALVRELDRSGRYRMAWLSARRRAQQVRAAADHIMAGLPCPVVLNERTEEVYTDAHTADLVLAGTAITPGASYWTCARYDHGIHPRSDFVHTAGPCPELDA